MCAAKSSFFNSFSRKKKKSDNKESSDPKEPDMQNASPDKEEKAVAGKRDNYKSFFSVAEGKEKEDSLSSRNESPQERKFFFWALSISGALILLFLLTFLGAFLLNVRGAEKAKVPDLQGMPLVDAVMALQEKGLNVRIQQRYSDNPQDRGTVLDQQPSAGTYTRAGRNVQVVVSKGGVLDTVGDYVGRDLDEVRQELQTMFLTHKPLIIIPNDVVFVHDPSPVGTILEQKPLPGTEIYTPVTMSLIVSRGKDNKPLTVADYTGKSYEELLDMLRNTSQPFRVSFSSESRSNTMEVVNQTPRPRDTVNPGTAINLVIAKPKNVPDNYGFGILSHDIPVYDTYSSVKVVKISKDGQESEYFSSRFPGGTYTIPYLEEQGSILILYVFGKEVTRINVTESP